MEFLVVFLVMLAKVIFLTLILFILPIPLTWMERKVAGHIQQRLGPMRTGWHGAIAAGSRRYKTDDQGRYHSGSG